MGDPVRTMRKISAEVARNTLEWIMSDYGDLCRDLREIKRELRAKLGVPCPSCVRLLPRANPSILLPGQRCKIHKYRDPRKRTADNEYLHRVKT